MVPPDSPEFWSQRVAMWGQDAEIGKIWCLWRQSRVGFRGNLVKPSLDSQALISPLFPCIGVELYISSAACCSLRGWSHDGARNSKKCKIRQRVAHRKLHNSF